MKKFLAVIIGFWGLCLLYCICLADNPEIDTGKSSVLPEDSVDSTDLITMGSVEELSPDEQKIIETTEKVRGLSAGNRLAPIYQTEEELRSYLIEQINNTSDEDLRIESALYIILGFIPEDFDLRQFYVDLYSEQIAGFYDSKTNEMHLIGDGSSYDNALTLAHEYTHFLQYNTQAFEPVLHHDEDFCTENVETCLIIDALVEGDASLTETLINPNSLLGERQNGRKTTREVFYAAPKYFQDTLLFPYKYGFDFVSYHYLKGGFSAVNDLYMNLPQSIEQIMHPEKYQKDLPIDVSLEPYRTFIEKDFDIKRENVLNESDIRLILGSSCNENWRLSERQAEAGSAGWGGGSYLYAEKDGKPLFFSKTLWDSDQDADEAETTFEMYSNKRFGEQTGDKVWAGENGSSVYMIRQDNTLYWMILPDNSDRQAIINMILRNDM